MDKLKFVQRVTDLWDVYLPYNMPDSVLYVMGNMYDEIYEEGSDDGYERGVSEASYESELRCDCRDNEL